MRFSRLFSPFPAMRLPRRARWIVSLVALGCWFHGVPALAESTQLQAMREQLAQLEQLNRPEFAQMVVALRELVAKMEEEERAAASGGAGGSYESPAGDTSTIREGDGGSGAGRYSPSPQQNSPAAVSPPPRPPAVVRKSYFTETGRPKMERCPSTGEAAIDNLCPIAMIRYQNYLAAAGTGDPAAQELWTLHAQTALVYLAALEDFGMDPTSPSLASTARDAPRGRATTPDTRDPKVFGEGDAVKSGREPSKPVVSDREKPPPCVKSRPNVSCVSPQ